jgi:broad specificity phosphatase PhoE
VTTRILLIAHAATDAQRRAAFPLDELISEQDSSKMARWDAPRIECIRTAPEQRAQQTARALGLTATISEQLRDCDYGRWRGRGMEQVQAAEPESILTWLTDPSVSPHGGESIADLMQRVGGWLDEQREGKGTIAVTHPAVIRAAIIHALRIPAQTFWRFDVAPLTLTDLRFSRNVWTLRCVGCALQRCEE